MKSFNLLEKTINFTDEQLLYFSIRSEYMKIALDAAAKARNEFYDVFQKFSDLHEKGATWIVSYLTPVVEHAIKELGNMKYYDLDSDTFFELMNTDSLSECLNRVLAKKEEVESTEEERERERAARTEAAGSSWSGGGFGLSGALKGAATAGALNLGGAAISGTFNMIGRGISACANAAKLRNFLEAEETIDSFINTLIKLIFEVRDTFIAVAEENCKKFKIKQLCASDREKAERIFKNIKANIIPEEDILDNIIRIIEQYPYIEEVYQYLAEKYDDKNFEIEDIADFFNYDIKTIKKQKLDSYFSELPCKTESQMLSARKAMKAYAKKIGIKNYKTYSKLEEMIEDYDKKARTFNGIEYPSRELANKHKELYNFFTGLKLDTEEKALNAKNIITAQAEKLELKLENDQYPPLEKLLCEFDKKARTAGDKIFATREEADLANRHIQLDEFFQSMNLSTEQQAIAAREVINQKIEELKINSIRKYEPLENLIKQLHIHEENMYFAEFFKNVDFNKIFIYPDIPENKLNSAIKSYNADIKSTDVIVIVDDTFLGGCEDGIIITKTHMYFHSANTVNIPITNPITFTLSKTWTGTKIFADNELIGKLTITDETVLTILFNSLETMINSLKTSSPKIKNNQSTKSKPTNSNKSKKTVNKAQKNNDTPLEILNNIKDEKIFIAPNIPAKKINNALSSYASSISPEDVLVLIDDTLWGGAKDGCILTTSEIYAKEFMGEIKTKVLSSDLKITLENKKLFINDQVFINFTMPNESSLKLFVSAIKKLLPNH